MSCSFMAPAAAAIGTRLLSIRSRMLRPLEHAPGSYRPIALWSDGAPALALGDGAPERCGAPCQAPPPSRESSPIHGTGPTAGAGYRDGRCRRHHQGLECDGPVRSHDAGAVNPPPLVNGRSGFVGVELEEHAHQRLEPLSLGSRSAGPCRAYLPRIPDPPRLTRRLVTGASPAPLFHAHALIRPRHALVEHARPHAPGEYSRNDLLRTEDSRRRCRHIDEHEGGGCCEHENARRATAPTRSS
jgi:hypothetical protein